ncbi:MAG: ABC transporter permease [Firmicutes bacterium]|nr:ABC transporter permease [Bacillota bacterium]
MKATRILTSALAVLAYTFILAPILVILPASLADGPAFVFPPRGFTTAWYARLIHDPQLGGSLLVSLGIGLAAAAGAVALGAAVALGIERGRIPARGVWLNLFLGPLVLPLILTGLAMLMFFSSLGWIGSTWGIVIAHIVLTTPYAVRTVLASLTAVNPALEEAAWVHGAEPWYAFRTVVFPQIRPGLVAGGLFAFLVSLDEYTVTVFLTGPGLVTLPIRIFQYITLHVDPTVSALASAMVIVSAALLIVAERKLGIHRYLEL